MLSQIYQGFYNSIKLWPETWASTTAYALGDLVKAVSYTSKTFLVTTAGTTASVEPAWSSTEGTTVSSGTCVFTVKDTKSYNLVAPQSASLPYVVFGLNTERPMGDFEDFEGVEDLTFWVNCFSNKSIADASEISDEVMDALDNVTLTASNYTNMKTQHEFISSPIYDQITNSYQISLRFRVWMDKT